jgi:hypothetical protein
MDKKIEAQVDHRTVDTIIVQTERGNDNIDLNPKYQRDIVWDDDKQSAFINSVIRGIVPNNLLLNINEETGKQICMDGKQRITSLIRFKNNEIPCIMETDEDIEEHLFFNAVPVNYLHTDKSKIMTQPQRTNFLNRRIAFVSYKNLSYEDQTDIFTRIQHGIALSDGEKITSCIPNEIISEEFNKFCASKKDLIGNFNSNPKRREHHKIIILNTMIMYETNKSKIPNKNDQSKYLKKMDSLLDLKKLLLVMSGLFNCAFSDKLLHHKILGGKLPQNILYMVLFIISKDKGELGYKKLISNNDDLKRFRSVIKLYDDSRRANNNKIGAVGNKTDSASLAKIKAALINKYINITDEEIIHDYTEENVIEEEPIEEIPVIKKTKNSVEVIIRY